jgi:predicted RNA binding protein YcfA (HicA-like mRNA interferase family)
MSIARKKLIRQFRRLGFNGPLSGGRHQFMAKGNLKIRIPNPHGNDISDSLLKEILRQAGIPREDFDQQ